MKPRDMVSIALDLHAIASHLAAIAADADAEGSEQAARAAGVVRALARQARNLAVYLANEALGAS